MEHIGEVITVVTWLMVTIVAALSSPRRLKELEGEGKELKIRVQKQETIIAALMAQNDRLEDEFVWLKNHPPEKEEFPF